MEPIEQQLTQIVADQKTFVAKVDEEIKNLGGATQETKDALATIREMASKMQTQLDAVDAKTQERLTQQIHEEKTVGDNFLESARFLEAKAGAFRDGTRIRVPLARGAFPTESKSTISNTGLGVGTPGIGMPALVGTPLLLAQIELRVRNIMRTRAIDGNTYYWIKQSTRTNAASPQVEDAAKAESTYAWDTASDDVTTIAHWADVTTQALDDIPWLRKTIDSELLYGLLLKEEQEILAGSGAGLHLNGLITQATAYDTGTYNVAGDTKLDKLRHAKLQARLAGLATFAPSAFVVHPTDMHTIELIKDQASNVGNYVVGDPKVGTEIKMVWGLPVVESDSITAGTFLVGAFNTAAEIVDRMQAVVDISFENSDNFIKNKATLRAEERIGLAVMRPTAFIYGSY